jgi:hypothetical protein
MCLFFPSFFNKLSSTEIDYLKCNENWVLDLFGDLWGLLMKNIEKSDDYCALRPLGCDFVSPEDNLTSPPSGDEPLNIVPLSILDPEGNLPSETCLLKVVYASDDPPHKISSLGSLTPDDPIVTTPSHFPKVVDSLDPKPLLVYNLSTLLPSATLRSNVTIRKKTRA